jgi:predicted MFS family arabinose efflux permease
LLALMFTALSNAAEAPNRNLPRHQSSWLGLHRSRGVVLRLSALFALDAFGGGFILQSIVAYWLYIRFQLDPALLGSIFFVANLLAAGSALGAAALARRFGLINTMVFTHLPSNILLLLVPLMPTATLAVAVLLMRFAISQMDVPTRQSYTMAVVHPDERSAASGLTTVARSVGAAISPTLAGYCLANPALISVPFFIAGGVKIVYDLCLYRAFVSHKPDGLSVK